MHAICNSDVHDTPNVFRFYFRPRVADSGDIPVKILADVARLKLSRARKGCFEFWPAFSNVKFIINNRDYNIVDRCNVYYKHNKKQLYTLNLVLCKTSIFI